MKRLLWCCLWLVASVGALAQVPSFKSFNPTQFSTNNFIISVKDGAPLTNINGITTINLNGTNIVNLFAPASLTNQFHWTNDLNVLKPISGTSVQVTNLTAFQTLASAGAFILDATGASTLDLGTNCVSALQQGGLALSGPTSDPADTTFNIDGGNFSGHLMFILNASDNSGFTFLNGSPFCDGTPGAFVRLNGDWITQTKGDGLLLYNFNGNLWTEVGRFSGSTNIITGDNVWENVLAGNIQPVHGNENNVLHFTSGLDNNSTNVAAVVGTTNLWSAAGAQIQAWHNAFTNVAFMNPDGGIDIGRNVIPIWAPDASDAFVAVRDISVGESATSYLYLQVVDSVSENYDSLLQGRIIANDTTPSTLLNLRAVGTNNFSQAQLQSAPANSFLKIFKTPGVPSVSLTPDVASSGSAVAHFLDTSNYLNTSGDLLAAFRNAGTNQAFVSAGGGIGIGQGVIPFYGNLDNSVGIVAVRDAVLDDINSSQSEFGFTDGGAFWGWDIIARSSGSPGTAIQGYVNDVEVVSFTPQIASSGSAVAHFLDTSNVLTNGDKSLSIRNAGTEQLNISPVGGGVLVGPNANAFWGSNADAATLVGAKVTSLGDGEFNQIFVGTSLAASGVDQGQVFSLTQTNRAENSVFVYEASNPFSMQTVVDLTGSGVDAYVQYDADGSVKMKLHPTVTSGTAVAYNLDTSNTLTNGDTFLSISNAGTPLVQFAPAEAGNPAGQIVWGPGTTNILYRSGRNLIYTNSNTGNISFSSLNGLAAGVSIGTDTGGNPLVSASTATLYLDQSGGSDGVVLNNSSFGTRAAGTLDLGQFQSAWATVSLTNAILWQMAGVATNLLLDTYTQGTPEGSKSSLPGSVVRDVTNGDLYVKKTGAGNTGYLKVATTGTGAGDQTEYLDADETENTTTPNALAISATVTSAGKYAFTLTVFVDNSTDADGACIDFDGGSATMTSFRAQTKVFDTALGLSSNSTALATDLCVATLTGTGAFEVSGGFTVNAGGTFIPRFFMNAATTGTLTAFRNSTLTVTAAN